MKYITSFLLMIFSVILCFSTACTKKVGEISHSSGVAYFDVSFSEDTETGTEKAPVEKRDVYTFTVDITAMDADGAMIDDYNGKVEIKTQYGLINSLAETEITKGKKENFEVKIKYAFRKELITVHEIETPCKYDESNLCYTGIVGTSKSVYLPQPSISDVQSNHSADRGCPSRMVKRNLTVRGEYDHERKEYNDMIVTAVIGGGFYMSELPYNYTEENAVHPGETKPFGSIYLYTYSAPYVDDAGEFKILEKGSVIKSANGSVENFFGFTELSFPNFNPLRETVESHGGDSVYKVVVDESVIPSPKNITDILGEDSEVEKYEAGLVKVDSITIDDFDENEDSYRSYGQFPLKTADGKHIMAQTVYTIPSFRPEANKGKKIVSVTGVLKQHTSARPSTWILIPRDEDDFIMEK